MSVHLLLCADAAGVSLPRAEAAGGLEHEPDHPDRHHRLPAVLRHRQPTAAGGEWFVFWLIFDASVNSDYLRRLLQSSS